MFSSIVSNFFHRGTSPKFSPGVNKRIILTNYILVLTLIAYPFGFFVDLLQDSANDPIMTFCIVVFTLLCIYLNHNNQSKLARVLTVFLILLTPIYYSQYYDREAGIILLYMTIAPLTFTLFSLREKGWIYLSLVLSVGLGTYLEFVDHKVWNLHNKLPVEIQEESFLPTFIICTICSFLGTFWLTRQNQITEKKLAGSVIKAREGEKAKAEFLSTMSHEIRTPLNGIINLAESLKNRTDSTEKDIELLNLSTKNLMSIVNNILDYSKIEAGKINLEQRSFKLKEVLEVVKHNSTTLALKKGLHFRINIDSDVPKMLVGDTTRLNQILFNFLDNALKFTETGFIELNLSVIEENLETSTIQFEIIDTGIGIPKEKIDTIFDLFTQASSSTTRKYGGTGLGLSICKQLIELQGGKLVVNSKVNIGTNIKFTIPYSKSLKDVEYNEMDASVTFTEENAIRILFIEDNEINQYISIQLFKHLNIDYDVYDEPTAALSQSSSKKYDMILTDFHMPNMNGIELAKAIRSDKENPNYKTPILLLTADIFSSIKDESIEAGISEVLIKPINQRDFKTKLLKYLSPS